MSCGSRGGDMLWGQLTCEELVRPIQPRGDGTGRHLQGVGDLAVAHLTGQYGVDDMYVGVPTVIGAGGVERIVEIELEGEEKTAFNNSVDAVKGLIEACKAIDESLA